MPKQLLNNFIVAITFEKSDFWPWEWSE